MRTRGVVRVDAPWYRVLGAVSGQVQPSSTLVECRACRIRSWHGDGGIPPSCPRCHTMMVEERAEGTVET
jgi:hypothetical protein